ncbi:MAG: MATE family efflux transporter [Pseudoclavibacter sp.]
MLSMIVTLVYNTVDTFFVAHTGNADMVAGVALAAPLFTVLIAIGDIFGLGGSSVISRLFGEGKSDEGRRVSAFCFWAAVVVGIGVAVVLLVAEKPILTLLGASKATLPHASQYYRWIAMGAPFIIVSMTPSNLLRTEGLAAASMIGTIVGTVVNIVFNPILISGVGWGAAGSAIATVIGNIISDAIFVWFVLRRSRNLSLDPRSIRISMKRAGSVFAIGLPSAVTNLMQSLGVVLVNRFMLPFGTLAVAAMGISLKVTMVAVLILVGFSFGAQPLIGYAYGAGNTERLRGILKFAYTFECALALGMTLLLAIPAPTIMHFFIADEAIVSMGSEMLRIQLVSMVFVAIVMIATCTFQSEGKAVQAFLLSFSRQGALLAIALAIAAPLAGYVGVVAAQPIADVLTAGLAIALLLVGRRKSPRRLARS